MNSSTTKTSNAVEMFAAHCAQEVARSAPARLLRRAAGWLKAQRARRAGLDDRIFLYCLVDDCGPGAKPPVRSGNEDQLVLYTVSDYADLERRIRQINRHRGQSAFAIGGPRF